MLGKIKKIVLVKNNCSKQWAIRVNQKIAFFGSEIWKPGKLNIGLG
jgi:hypothetical protein